MKTFRDLFLFLQSGRVTDIRKWLLAGNWKGKDKQESLLRLFSRLGLITKLSGFDMCLGNFNLMTIHRITHVRDVFLTPHKKEISLKDKGDASDLTGINRIDPKRMLACTSKSGKNVLIGKLDLEGIETNFRGYKEQGYELTLCIAVRDAEGLRRVLSRAEKTSTQLNFIASHQTIIVDWEDLNEAFHRFKQVYGETPYEELIGTCKRPLILRAHQELCCRKTMRSLRKGATKILWGHVPRSGKTYTMAGLIAEHSAGKERCNYLIVTTAPKETIRQYLDVFGDHHQFNAFQVFHLDGKMKKPALKDKNIIICSKQFLQNKTIRWLSGMALDVRFIDESHNGGTTELAQKTFLTHGGGCPTIYVTATYSKPVNDYDIPREDWVLWDMEDVRLCQHVDDAEKVARLVEKHGEDVRAVLDTFSADNVRADYDMFPDMHVLTAAVRPEVVPAILQATRDNWYGWSADACFLLKQTEDGFLPEFQDRGENLKLWQMIFGKRDAFGIPHKDFPDDLVFMRRIERFCKHSACVPQKEVIMAFLPPNNIDLVSQATRLLLEEEGVVPGYDILCVNHIATNDPKQAIEDAKTRARVRGKKGVLVLSGKQCHMGVTIDGCGIVLLLNNTQSYDTIFQMMFRCMTEGCGKKAGFVVDMNTHRFNDNVLMEHGAVLKPNDHPRDAIRHLLEARIINLNGDHWMPCFGHGAAKLTRLVEAIYDDHVSRMSPTIGKLFERMTFKADLFAKEDYDAMKRLFSNVSPRRVVALVEKEEKIKPGIERIKADTDTTTAAPTTTDSYDPSGVFRTIAVLLSLLTIHDASSTTLDGMYHVVNSNPQKKSILLDQLAAACKKRGLKEKDMEWLVGVFKGCLDKDPTTARLVRHVKEIFSKNVANARGLSEVIDKHLVPRVDEKKTNAEVSTPHALRKDMLATLPLSFWQEPRKVLEPCCGKGGFLLDIVDKFDAGLTEKIPDAKERHRVIVEECLYYGDINDVNTFICGLLLDPHNTLKKNCHTGDTLKHEAWQGFDAVIGNPPYNLTENSRHILWDKFVRKAIDEWLVVGGHLLFVHPALWRKPASDHSKLNDLFRKMTRGNTMLYLEIHDTKDGKKTFRCGTRYDFYLIRKGASTTPTVIVDENGERHTLNLFSAQIEWLPNKDFDLFRRATSGTLKVDVIHSRSAYGNDKAWMSRIQTGTHQHPCVLSTPQSGVRWMYSSHTNNGHFGVRKVVFGETGTANCFYDADGRYGLTDGAVAIAEDDPVVAEKIVECLKSEKFNRFLKACSWSNYRIEWNMFRDMDKNFWKNFV